MNIALIEPLGIKEENISKFKNLVESLNHTFTYYNTKPHNEDDLINRIKDQNIVIVANYPISEKAIKEAKNLEYLNVAFTGLDHIPLNYIKENNIYLTNAKGYSNISVSEQVIGMTLALYRKLHLNDFITKSNKDSSIYGPGEEINGKTIGIIGLGEIGIKTAKLFEALGAEVIYYSRTKKDVKYKYVELDELLKTSDIISLHIPSNEETYHFLNKEKLDLIKKDAILINTARGKVIDNDYLAKLLNEDKIKGAAIDVFDYEPPLKDDYALIHAKNVLLTPHTAFLTKEALERRAEIVFNNILDYL